MKKLAIIFLGCFILSGFLFSDSDYKMVKNFSLLKNVTYAGSILSWNGTIVIQGNLKGSIILLGGRLELDGLVEEDVICVGANVDIRESTVVKGDLFIIGGTFNRSPGSVVNGKLFNSQVDLKKIEAALLPLLSDSQTIAFIRAIKIIIWLIIALILFALIPGKVINAEEILGKNLPKIAIIGVLSLIGLLCLLIIFIILSFFIIGIPLLFLLLIFYCVVYIFGRTVIFYFIGAALSNRFNLKGIAPAFFIVMGAAVYIVLKFVPYVGPIVLFILNFFELGIGVCFIFRKKLKVEAISGE